MPFNSMLPYGMCWLNGVFYGCTSKEGGNKEQ